MNLRLPWNDESNLLKHGTLLMVGTLTGAFCNAAFHVVVGRLLKMRGDGTEYGVLVAMMGVVVAVCQPLLAVQNTLAHTIATLHRDGRDGEIRALFLRWMAVFLVLSTAVAIAGWFFRAPLATYWNGMDTRLVMLTALVLAGTLWMSLFQGLWQGMQHFGWLAFAPQSWGVIRLLLGAASVGLLSATALSAMGAQAVGVLTVILLGAWSWRRMRLPSAPPGARQPPRTLRYLFSSVLCLTAYGLLMNVDTTLARHYFDPASTDLFARAATIARTAVFLPIPIAAALFPKVASDGPMDRSSWRLLIRALLFGGAIIAAVMAVCILFPMLPWTILYGPCAPADVPLAAAWTRAMVRALGPLSLVYLLLNFEMAQRRFFWPAMLIPCALFYVAGVHYFHQSPVDIAFLLGVSNSVALGLFLLGIGLRRLRQH